MAESLGLTPAALVQSLVEAVDAGVARLAELTAGPPEALAQAAHALRNDALMLGARELEAQARTVEEQAREGSERAAAQARELGRCWPALRTALLRESTHPSA